MIQTGKARLRKAVDLCTYRLDSRSAESESDHTDLENMSKISKHMTAQMKSHICDPFDSVSIIGFLCKFDLACDTNGIRQDAVTSLFNFFKMKSTSAVLNTRLSLK